MSAKTVFKVQYLRHKDKVPPLLVAVLQHKVRQKVALVKQHLLLHQELLYLLFLHLLFRFLQCPSLGSPLSLQCLKQLHHYLLFLVLTVLMPQHFQMQLLFLLLLSLLHLHQQHFYQQQHFLYFLKLHFLHFQISQLSLF
jgi:hypothetical protein